MIRTSDNFERRDVFRKDANDVNRRKNKNKQDLLEDLEENLVLHEIYVSIFTIQQWISLPLSRQGCFQPVAY